MHIVAFAQMALNCGSLAKNLGSQMGICSVIFTDIPDPAIYHAPGKPLIGGNRLASSF
jgi:hypothetical protein